MRRARKGASGAFPRRTGTVSPASGTPASMAARNDASGARSTPVWMSKRWSSGPSRPREARSATRRCCPICSARFPLTWRSARFPQTEPLGLRPFRAKLIPRINSGTPCTPARTPRHGRHRPRGPSPGTAARRAMTIGRFWKLFYGGCGRVCRSVIYQGNSAIGTACSGVFADALKPEFSSVSSER